MIQSLTERGVSGLGYLASALDKPGRAVRGVLGGRMDEALAAVPFSDSLGITDPKRAVSGRDLLDQAGVTRRSDNGWGAWGAGLAAEMALDPLMFASLGPKTAMTATGQAISKAGLAGNLTRKRMLQGFEGTVEGMRAAGETEPVIRHAIDSGRRVATEAMEAAAAKARAPIVPGSPLGGLVGIGLPFRDPSIVLGTGKRSQAVAGAMDAAGDWLQYGNPVGRYIGSHFDKDKGEATSAVLQRAFKARATPLYKELEREGREHYRDLTSGMSQAMASGVPEMDLVSAVNRARESVPYRPGTDPAVANAADPIGQLMRGYADQQFAQAKGLGAPTEHLADKYVAYGPRVAAAVEKGSVQPRPGVIAPMATGSDVHRQKALRDVPGGTDVIDDLARAHAGMPALGFQADVLQRLTAEAQLAGVNLTPEELAFLDKKSGRLATAIGGMDPKYRERDVPFFSPNLPATQKLRDERHAKAMRSTEATLEALAASARRGGQPGDVDMMKALKALRLRTRPADLGAGRAAEGASVEVLRRLARHGEGPVDDALLLDNKARRSALRGWHVPADVMDSLLGSWRKWESPSNAVQPIRVLDSATNLFKNLAYSVWLPSHVRNVMSGAVTNAIGTGAGLQDNVLGYRLLRDTATADAIRKAMPDLPAGLDDAAARDWAKRRAYVDAGVFSGHNAAQEIAGSGEALLGAVEAGDRITPKVPGSDRLGTTGSFLGDSLGLFREGILGKRGPGGERITSPFWPNRQAGIYDRSTGQLRRSDEWSVTNAGRQAGANAEDFSRLVGYLAGVRRGMGPAEAGKLTNKIHFEYGDLTGFEQSVMRRAMPFYTYMSRNLPLQLENLATRPATIASQLRPVASLRGEYTPDWIGSGVAIPAGQNEDGTSRYISQLGLPIEDAFERLKFSNGALDATGTAMAYAAGLNPYLKGPLEQLADRQFFSGRRLSDLRPTTAGTLGGALSDENAGLLTQLIANSPATRFATAFDKLIDDRKPLPLRALNLLTGVRVTDVDVEKAKAIETRRALEDLMRGRPGIVEHSNFYARPQDMASLTDQDVIMMRLYNEMRDRARKAADQANRGRG